MRLKNVAALSCLTVTAGLFVACGSDPGTTSPGLQPDPAGDAGSANPDAGHLTLPDTGTPDALTNVGPDAGNIGPDAGNVEVDAGHDSGGSGQFPAPHPPFPLLATSGGPTLATPKVVPIFYPGYDYTAQITDYLTKIGATPYWRASTSEYGVGPLAMGTAVHLTETAPATTDSGTIQSWIAEKLNGTHPEFGAPDQQTIYAIYFPASTQIDGPQGSCTSYGGYHDNVDIAGKSYAFAVIPQCATFGALTGVDMVTGAGSHELIEAATDPYPSTTPAWAGVDDKALGLEIFLGGNAENGDLCSVNPHAFFKPGNGFDYVVQRGYSNVAAKAGNMDPCAPARTDDEPYFAAAPLTTDTATLFNIQASVVQIAVGATKTIDVAAWSNAPTSGPMTVSAIQPRRVATPQLEFTWDRTTAVNGDTLKLTIKVLAAGSKKYESFAVKSVIGTQRAYWAGIVSTP